MDTDTKQSDNNLHGSLLVVLGAIGFSAKPVLIKLAYADSAPIDAITLMTLRALIALPFFLAVAFWQGDSSAKELRARDWAALVVLGVMGYYLASLLDFSGLKYITAGLERLILFLYPTFVVLLGAVLYRHRITRTVLAAMLLSYAGIFVVYASSPLAGSSDIALGALLVFGSAVAFALFLTGSGHLIPRFGSRRFTAYSMSAASLATLIHFLIFHPVAQLLVPAKTLSLAFALGIVSLVLPAFLINAGIRRIGASQASIITSVGPVATLALAYLILDETLEWSQLIGAVLVLLGVMLVGLTKRPS